MVPLVSLVMNHRDHRKIVVIDGNVAYTGGVNLADEYINAEQCFGFSGMVGQQRGCRKALERIDVNSIGKG